MPPLPLLRLPQLVLCEVFKSFSIVEKIKLSLCSKKMSRINISRLHSQKVIVVLDILNRNIRVHSENDEHIFDIFTYPHSGKSCISNTQQSFIACSAFISRGVQVFSKNHQERFRSIARNLLKMFQCKVTTNLSWYNSDLHQPMVSMLLDLQVKYKKLTISLHGSKDEILFNQISNKLELVEDLRISPTWLPGFSPVFTSWPKKITIMNSSWFTLEHLVSCTCTTITLGCSHLGNKDLDEILRKWKAGGFPNLEYLHVDRNYIKNNKTRLNPLELRGKVVQSDDGTKKATINTGNGRIEMSVTPF
ncbi:hypothetical protein CRE_22046 [Caenorhabditis remanei]|uniref:F-box domain-containing protein n=1 Tax=Caenorhabditis remanei TaxID=31234 RepID=E3N3J1_CAERE|nr:hypothetical protein CRE_22046 [Caenorhabditis remanei]